ncbi:pseudouridine synthase [Pontibacter silvestris]|uniref:Pseudouridine synthase n=2 Tax=Pontibacter silvestris TaxID=2305183 RepID=A0ABW4WY39_9BACT
MARENERPARGNAGAGRRGAERSHFGRPDNNEGKKIFNRRDKYESGEGREGGERRSFGPDRREGGERRSFGSDRRSNDRRPSGNREGGERRSFGSDRREDNRGDRSSFGEKRSFGGDSREGRRSFGGDRREGGERRSYGNDRREGGERRSYGSRNENSDRRSFKPRREDGDRKPFNAGGREQQGEGRTFNERSRKFDKEGREGGERRSFGPDRREGGERRSFGSDRRSNDRRPSGNREGGERRSFGSDRREDNRGDRSSFGEKRSFGGDRKPFNSNRSDKFSKGSDNSSSGIDPKTPDYNLSRYKDNPRIKKTNRKDDEDDGTIRLNRFIANAGVCSRREADSLIEAGEIRVNGDVVTEMGFKVKPEDTIQYGKKVLNREKLVYVLLNKPKDFITTTDDPEGRKTVMSLVEKASTERIFPVGRLDRNTTGLLLFTNDGELAQKLTHPSNNVKKIYQVELDKPITKEDFKKVAEGVELEDGKAEVDDVALIGESNKFLGLEIHIGRNRIVRRIFEHLGYEVVTLDRVQYAGLTKKDIPRSDWRYLSEKEVIRLKFFM